MGVELTVVLGIISAAGAVAGLIWPTKARKVRRAIEKAKPVLELIEQIARPEYRSIEGTKRLSASYGRRWTREEADLELRNRVRSQLAIRGIPWRDEYDTQVSLLGQRWAGIDKFEQLSPPTQVAKN